MGGPNGAPRSSAAAGTPANLSTDPEHRGTAIGGAMSGEARLVYEDSLTKYDFGRGHPMSPIRVQLTIKLARELGILDHLPIVPVPVASDELLRTVHTAEYVEAVKRAGADPDIVDLDHGLGSDDTYCFRGMHDVSAQIAGASGGAAEAVADGVTGRIVADPTDVGAVAAALEAYLDDPAGRAAGRRAARERAVRDFSYDGLAATLQAALGEVGLPL